MNKKNILIIANGTVSEFEIDKVRQQEFDIIIAADGGTQNALKHGITPDIIIGDLDSITKDIEYTLENTIFIHKPMQDINDLHKALNYCNIIDIESITVIGFTGKRLDHTINNISVLCKFDTKFKLILLYEYGEIFIVRENFEHNGTIGQTVSLIPLSIVKGVTTSGLKWNLNNEVLAIGIREGCSNRLIENEFSITIDSGILIVFLNVIKKSI